MKMTTRVEGDAFIIALKGKVMGGPESVVFHDELKAAVAKNHTKVVLDLGEVEWMNSSGLGLLVSAYTTLRNANGEMRLARLTSKIDSLLVITKLNSVFESHPTVEEAVASFR